MKPIGTIHTPFKRIEDMPVQPSGGAGVIGTVVLDADLRDGLDDLGGFSHVYLLYQFHRAQRVELRVVPFLDTTPRGVFATRSPLRPNHIGLSIVELIGIENTTLTVRNLDILDGTPLLDIKPYVERFDRVEASRSGWMSATAEMVAACRSDRRFG